MVSHGCTARKQLFCRLPFHCAFGGIGWGVRSEGGCLSPVVEVANFLLQCRECWRSFLLKLSLFPLFGGRDYTLMTEDTEARYKTLVKDNILAPRFLPKVLDAMEILPMRAPVVLHVSVNWPCVGAQLRRCKQRKLCDGIHQQQRFWRGMFTLK